MTASIVASTLYIVATPIGNRGDITHRAIEVLNGVDCIYAEDTRHSQTLLAHHGIATRRVALHEHNEKTRVATVLEALAAGGSAALISDAGTPLVSDPGYRLVRACHAAGIRVSPVPGPSALIAALSVSGLATDRFEFLGFPPAKASARKRWLGANANATHTLVLYESTHRILAALADIAAVFGPEREMCLARELTKRFETLVRGSVAEVIAALEDDPVQRKGEFVLVLSGAGSGVPEQSGEVEVRSSSAEVAAGSAAEPHPGVLGGRAVGVSTGPGMDAMISALLPELPLKRIARVVADLYGRPKREVYDRALLLQKQTGGGRHRDRTGFRNQ
ncbi:MAG: 16S rRNA (cytidine(1402)-2'-O)-methyltransferase [Gammaproteobacteria bacterium]|nr:MAG: 16S rRNA (cytidine(1402)-2'-O)-methyltransferase [Gammaproteobacteria bacterium]PIE35487.1 MAG: 16S rRNA (cytidine(1402)-2'-O)-methyltransferase [Gammaproteobacteria bacterium]